MNIGADRVAELADRPLAALTRRDVALALLTVPSADALESLPAIRRGLLAAGNPLSAVFWSSAEHVLQKISDGEATVGDVRTWLEATGTEPNGIIGLHVWDDQSERSMLAAEMHTRLVSYLEERLAAGEVDPDLLAEADPSALLAYVELQERWMTSALPDGRVPMDVLLDEKDDEFLAEWDAADAEALNMLQAMLEQVGERPVPALELRQASSRLRELLAKGGWPGHLLLDCSGLNAADLPTDDAELWVTVAAGVAAPVGEPTQDWPDRIDGFDSSQDGYRDSEVDNAVAAICAIDHFDWLAVITALAQGGPGTQASAADLAGYVRDYDPDDLDLEDDQDDEDDTGAADEASVEAGQDDEIDPGLLDLDGLEEFDELGMEGLFLPVISLWSAIGAIDDEDCLTPLGWWGLPEAMRRVWAPSDGEQG